MPYLRVGPETIYHEVHGTGEPLLLLHGGYCSLENMRPLGGLLAERYEVHAPERAGHGRTPDREGPYGYGRMLEETVAYLDAVGLDSVHVVGFSDGGILALLLALEHPGRVRRIVPISANIHTDAFVPEDYPHETVPQAAHERLDREYAELSPDGAEHGAVVLEKLLAMWTAEPDIPVASLAGIRVPTLVMAGEHDAIRRDHSELIASSIPGARLVVVPGTTHMLVSERPDAVAAEALGFLSAGG
ncbi:alpha/beta fold hydrolase [Protaetiibacter intestinalis]|uniref:Alpha/beta hydrolase n=1 Tax=Protaetiibacter intestinalis TaxID=2419774 RepID=A0A387B9P5_9MICO|nr:alpha/beta hydrolase [Protaetiibacter intestinalis]AYF97885.1 alpha/beta hydrolase [Protaetiibacter intestinalis]